MKHIEKGWQNHRKSNHLDKLSSESQGLIREVFFAGVIWYFNWQMKNLLDPDGPITDEEEDQLMQAIRDEIQEHISKQN